jgi:hypothetical protein
MTEASLDTMIARPHLSFRDRAATLLSWSIAGGLFLSIGWMAAAPDDPFGPVSLLALSHPVPAAFQIAALAAVASGIATVLAGRHLADVGPFAASIGLGILSVQGETSAYFLISGVENGPVPPGTLAARLGAESFVWFGVLMLTVFVSGVIGRWVFASRNRESEALGADEPAPAVLSASADLPWRVGASAVERTPWRQGLAHAAVFVALALIAYQVFSSGLHNRVIRHGQACFVVAASYWLATRFAFQLVPVRTTLWALLAVGATAVAAFLWAALRPGVVGHPAGIPGSHFVRVLPMQFVFVGAAAVIFTSWYREVSEEPAAENPTDDAREASVRKRGSVSKS